MEAREIRCGNFIKWNHKGNTSLANLINTHVVETISLNGDIWTVGGLNTTVDKIEPILLDEDWLIKFGFENGVWRDNTQSHEIFCDCKVLFISDARDTNYSFNAPCKYVHQLQNLYFALTGSELSVKQTTEVNQ